MHRSLEGYLQVFQDVIMIQLYKNPYPNKLAVIEYNESTHLLYAFTDSKHLYTVSYNC